MGLNDTQVFVDFNFVPPSIRRAIGLLGFIHKRVQEKCHPVLLQALSFSPDLRYKFHNRILVSHFDEVSSFRSTCNNSLWMYVLIYSRLAQHIVEIEDVKGFQSKLTHLARHRAEANDPHWRDAHQSCEDVVRYFYT